MPSKPKELDVVRLRDGRQCTILLEYTKPDIAYEVEFGDGEFGVISPDDIVDITYHA